MNRSYIITLVFVLSFSISSCQNTNLNDWKDNSEKNLIHLGFKIDSLAKAWRYIRDKTPVTGMFVSINGKTSIYFGDIKETSYVASVRKSILAILYGKYVDNGAIDLNTTLKELNIDDVKGLTDAEKEATIQDLLTARSGIYHPASNTGDDTKYAPKRGEKKHGEYFLYNNWDFNAAGGIFEKLTGKNIYVAFEEDIAKPLGMQDFNLKEQKKRGNSKRSKFLAYHFYLSTRDMARIGQLMLNKGKWNGKQIISESWVEKISSVVTPNHKMNPKRRRQGLFGYGYMWWVFDSDNIHSNLQGAYSATGSYGQFITVIPKLDMVVAIKTKDSYYRTTMPHQYYNFLKILLRSKG